MGKLKISFELESCLLDEIDGFNLGNMIIEGDSGTISSKHRLPDQSMMVFLSIVQLLYGVRHLVVCETVSEFIFVGEDSSFQFAIRKQNDRFYFEEKKGHSIVNVTTKELVTFLWEGVQSFVNDYGHRLDSQGSVYKDLFTSLKEFQQEFSL